MKLTSVGWLRRRAVTTRKVLAEAESAQNKYGDFASTHEGYGVLAEEVAELVDAIRSNDKKQVAHEAMQVSAVALRIAMQRYWPRG